MSGNVLTIEDDTRITEWVRLYFERVGYSAEVADDSSVEAASAGTGQGAAFAVRLPLVPPMSAGGRCVLVSSSFSPLVSETT